MKLSSAKPTAKQQMKTEYCNWSNTALVGYTHTKATELHPVLEMKVIIRDCIMHKKTRGYERIAYILGGDSTLLYVYFITQLNWYCKLANTSDDPI